MLALPFNLALHGISKVLYGYAWLLMSLIGRESQRAEFLADHLAARIAGTDAAVSSLRMLSMHDTVELAIQQHRCCSEFAAACFRRCALRSPPFPSGSASGCAGCRSTTRHGCTPPTRSPATGSACCWPPLCEPRSSSASECAAVIDGELEAMEGDLLDLVYDAHRRRLGG